MGSWNAAWANTMQDGVINDAIAKWHADRPDREQSCATPSTLMDCPRAVWLRYVKKIAPPLPMGWGKAQRMLLGRQLETLIAKQLDYSGNLLYHWKDDDGDEPFKFEMGKGETKIIGTPDLLLEFNGKIAISDAKTSMAKSFGYIPLHPKEIFKDYYWKKYQLQVEAYYLLCLANKDWFERNKFPLPEVNHLFSYALDNGVNYRDIVWEPTEDAADEVLRYARRWNRAYASQTIPACTCSEFNGDPVKFCYYTQEQMTTRTGAKIGIRCCGEDLAK